MIPRLFVLLLIGALVILAFRFISQLQQVNPKATTPLPTAPPGYTLVWNDEFNGATLDATKWVNPPTWDTRCSPRNNEQEIYTPDNVYLENGYLVLRSQNVSSGGCNYTSGAVSTYGKFTQAYGRFEISAQMPAGGQGIWPAIWMYPPNQWPPEIDFMEAINNMNTVYMTYHWGTVSNHLADGSSYQNTALTTGYHEYAVEWDPGEIRWYIDGVLRKTHSGSDATNIPMMIYLNTALGGSWPGNVGASTVFPQYFKIDYVRVYTKSTTPTPTPTPTPTSTPTPVPTPTPTLSPTPTPTPTPTPMPTSIPTPSPTPSPISSGNGLNAAYYNGVNFASLLLSRTDLTINFDWGYGGAAVSLPIDQFSVRWTGYIIPPASGTYTFYARTDDGVRVWVNNVRIISYWRDQAATERKKSIYLTGGRKYPFSMDYYENTGNASAQLFWRGPGISKQIIPSNVFYLR